MKKEENIRMNRHDKRIFTQFAESVRQQFPGAGIWAFGSRVKGTATQESDLDVCIVLGQSNLEIDRAVREIAWEVGFEHDVLISSVIYSREAFENGPCSQSSLVHRILEEGVAA